jgi:hypothetical protein
MIKSDSEMTLIGSVMNVTDRALIPNAKINLQLVKQDDSKDMNLIDVLGQPKPKTVAYAADKEGKYQIKIPASYMPYSFKRTSYFIANPELAGLELAITGSVANGKPENIDFTGWQTDYYMVDEKQEGVLKGTLLDKDGNPMRNIPIVVKLGQRKG